MYQKKDVFLITGGTSGIGAGCALELNAKGATVISVGRDRAKMDQLKKIAPNKNRFITMEFDLSGDMQEFNLLIKDLVKKYEKLRGCVVSSGIQDIQPLSSIKEDSALKMIKVNYLSSLMIAKTFCDKRFHRPDNASLVFVSSISAIRGYRAIANYSATKGALNALTRSIASEVAREGVRVNAVLLGLVKTEMIEKNSKVYTEKYLKDLDEEYPLGIGSVDDTIGPILFLLSEQSKWITGTEIIVDGGASL